MDFANPDYLIDASALHSALDSDRLRLFDATVLFSQQPDGALSAESGRTAYEQEHIPSAAFFDHLDAFADTASPLRNTLLGIDALNAAIGAAGIGEDHQVVVYSSQYLMWATRAWWMLHYAGHNHVQVLNGGLGAWKAAGLPTQSGTHIYSPTTYTGTPRHDRYADKDTIAAAIDGPACTIDALPEAVYTGAAANHYGRPGHIAGAVNLPYYALQTQEAYNAPDQVVAALSERGLLDAEQVYSYCGGGIAATVDALACLLCGQTNVAVYDGSMSEWSLDPEAPIHTGTSP